MFGTGIVVLAVAGSLLFVASAGAGSKRVPPCRVDSLAPHQVPPNGITATASLRCSRSQRRVLLVVDLVVPGSHGHRNYDRVPGRGTFGVVVRNRAVLPAVQVGSPYRVTAKTSKCATYEYATVAQLFVGGRRAGLWLSRHPVIDCGNPADNRCDVVAQTPTMAGGDLLARGSFTCVSDQQALIYTVTLQEFSGGSWQDDGTIVQGVNGQKGGHTVTRTVHQPCANEGGPPWPRDFRTLSELQRPRGPSIMRTSATASLSCPSPPMTLTVHLNGGGAGTVTSSPGGIDCPQTCSHAFTYGSRVTLTAQPAAGSTFHGWVGPGPPPGPCSGNGTCTITVDNTYGPPYVYADFELAPG